MTTPPKTMAEIRDEEADRILSTISGYRSKEAFKAGWDARDKLDNEALRMAVEAIEDIVGCEAELFGEKVVKALAEIRKLRGEVK